MNVWFVARRLSTMGQKATAGLATVAWALSTWGRALLTGDDCGRKNDVAPPRYAGCRLPVEIIGHAVWRYCRFARGFRDVEEWLAERGVIVTDETIRRWSREFGQTDAHGLRQRRPRPGAEWHRDAVCIGISGARHDRWRAVAQEGHARDRPVPSRRNAAAARKARRKRLTGRQDVPRAVITGKRASYGVATRDALPRVERRRHTGRNTRAENAHRPARARARRRRRSRAPGRAQRFRAAYGPIAGHGRPRRPRLTAQDDRDHRDQACAVGRAVTGMAAAA